MQMPAPTWEMIYAADRRKHRHRCCACNRIVQPGERVVMARVAQAKTRVIHAACQGQEATNGFSWSDLLRAHGIMFLASLGWKEAKAAMDAEPIFRPAAHA